MVYILSATSDFPLHVLALSIFQLFLPSIATSIFSRKSESLFELSPAIFPELCHVKLLCKQEWKKKNENEKNESTFKALKKTGQDCDNIFIDSAQFSGG